MIGVNWGKWLVAISVLALAGLIIPTLFGHLTLGFIVCISIIALAALVLIIQRPDMGIYLFIALVPFERIPSVNVHGMTLRISQVLLAWLIISLLYRNLTSIRSHFSLFTFHFPLPYTAYLLFIAGFLGSFVSMHDYTRGIQVLAFIIFTSLSLWVLPELITAKQQLDKVTKIILAISTLLLIFGIYQFVGDAFGLPILATGLRDGYTSRVFGFARIHATELEPLYFANYLILPFTLALTFYLKKIGVLSKYLVWFMILCGIVFLLTLARGAYLGLFVSLIVVIAYNFKAFSAKRNLWMMLVILLSVIVGVAALLSISNFHGVYIGETIRHFLHLGNDFSAQERVSRYGDAFRAIQSHPIFGLGVGNFGPWLAGYPTSTPASGWLIVNNETLEILAETGIVGLLLSLVGVVGLLWRSVKAIHVVKDEYLKGVMIALFAALVGTLVQYQTFSVLYIMQIWVLAGLVFATQQIIFRQVISGK